ncbi:DnaJ-domain-containing protein [Cucurbitaria berberidis CBS 394.84]|uniref:DnaJ-domain-containing protein n=1 Tax=Cucurbitaria berberidis CBS 394.84 TaxID=1168544 RepID=A0A9P4GVM1_9PLEO|nr:DnaJ-domain-containing protein [Cucurbitaria berberidis CBS 394.84]KAF1852132.1 DnaJ-domain-containing protein [Cucurbitaria berberidis CBS 394.84]
MTFKDFEAFHARALRDGLTQEAACKMAVKRCVVGECNKLGLATKHNQAVLEKAHDYWKELRGKRYPLPKAWSLCEDFIKKEVKREYDNDLLDRTHKALGKGRSPSGFDSFAGMKKAIPKHNRGSLYDEDVRALKAQARDLPHVRVRVDERCSGGRDDWQGSESDEDEVRPSGERMQASRGTPKATTTPHASRGQPRTDASTQNDLRQYRTRETVPGYSVSSQSPQAASRQYSTRIVTPGDGNCPQPPQFYSPYYPPQAYSPYYPPQAFFHPPPPTPPQPSYYQATPPPELGVKPKHDLYEVLGVDKSASASDITKAYRKMSLKHHPDKLGLKYSPNKVPEAAQQEANEKIREITEANQVLSDAEKRAKYDRTGCI